MIKLLQESKSENDLDSREKVFKLIRGKTFPGLRGADEMPAEKK